MSPRPPLPPAYGIPSFSSSRREASLANARLADPATWLHGAFHPPGKAVANRN